MPSSPSITILERDQSQFAAVDSESILAIVGYATKGPIEEPTTVTSYLDFVNKFGPTPKDSPFSSLAVRRAFRNSNRLVFSRVAEDDANFAERVVTGTGDSSISWRLRIRSKEKGSAVNGSFVRIEEIDNPVGDNKFNVNFYYLRNGDSILIEIFEEVSFEKASDDFFVNRINASILNKGSRWISADLNHSTAADSNVDVTLDTTTAYILGAGPSTEDEWSTGDTWTANTGDSTAYDFREGTDGIPDVGGDTKFVNALDIDTDLANAELFDYNLLITPDNNSQAVQNAAIDLVESRGDALYLVDPPSGLNQDEIVEWHNGVGGFGRTNALNTSYAALYYSWLTDYNPDAGEYVSSPPSVFASEKMLENDRTQYPWIAVAGSARGVVQAFDSEYSASFGQRDKMYGGLNAVNPIVNFPSKGLIIWGQKTLLRQRSALNRINVRRMLIYIKKLLRTSLDPILFEPNDASSWVRANSIVTAILEPVRQRRGISTYAVAFDSTTTSSDDIANNILRGRIRIVPVSTIEFIEVGINILPTGTSLSEI